MSDLKLFIYEFGECDPKKCSGHRLVKFNKVKSLNLKYRFNGIMLSPEATKTVSKNDREIMEKYGLGCIDCSWNQINNFDFKRVKSKRPTPGYCHFYTLEIM